MNTVKDITIIGAGPYGLSIAAHLKGYDIDSHIIGRPMDSWRSKMPKGMLLKSPGFASSLSDPEQAFTLRDFCKRRGAAYEDIDFPIPVETFSAYGLAFQERYAPNLEQDDVVRLEPCSEGFRLSLAGGASYRSRKVVIAVGIDYFRHMPAPLRSLPDRSVSHSADHHDLARFNGKEVAVLGGGASAVDLAVLLQEAGASVQLVVRRPVLEFGNPWRGRSRPLWRRIREPVSGIGPGWRSRLCTDAPWLYRYMPDDFRLRVARTHLGPAAGWFMRERAASVPLTTGMRLEKAEEYGGGLRLLVADSKGAGREIFADHVIAATGYQNDVRRLPFLPRVMLDRMRRIDSSPLLSSHFESSIPGLYFAGPIAVTSFGPVMRFVAGTGFASRRISAHLARAFGARSRPVLQNSPVAGTR